MSPTSRPPTTRTSEVPSALLHRDHDGAPYAGRWPTPTPDGGAADRLQLRGTNYVGVQLTPSRLADQLESASACFRDVSVDSLLWPFRVRKGLPSPGRPLRGWYGEGLFNNIGQFMTAFARLHLATRDSVFAEKAAALYAGWEETLDEDGFFFNAMNANTKEYCFDKIVCGLLDLHEYLDLPTLTTLRRITVWMQNNGDQARPYAFSGFGLLEWYTLAEYLLRAYAVTGDQVYSDMAMSYRYDEYYRTLLFQDLDELMRRADQVKNFYQAHSHVNTLNSAAAIYQATGESRYLDAAIAGHDLVTSTQTFATGMFGPNEAFMRRHQLDEVLHSEVAHAEISCPSWALNRLVKHLVELTGSARYGDWMELNLCNGIGAAPTTDNEGRATQYFADYGHAGARKTWGLEWTCCSTTNVISVAEHVNQIYYTSDNAVHVLLYVPSTADLRLSGTPLQLTQTTSFPESDQVEFRVGLTTPTTGTLAFRIPEWAGTTPSFTLRGAGVERASAFVEVQPVVQGGWAKIFRTWRDGDQLTMRLDMRLDLVPVTEAEDNVALRWGPVVLVVPGRETGQVLSRTDAAALVSSATRLDEPGLRFRGRDASGSQVDLIAYYAVEMDTPYAMHFAADVTRIDHTQITYTPADAWDHVDVGEHLLRERRTYHLSRQPGAAFQADFVGTGLVWAGYRSPRAGYADIFIDDRHIERITQRGNSTLQPSCWSIEDLPSGPHTLRVVVSGHKPETSLGLDVNVKHLRVIS